MSRQANKPSTSGARAKAKPRTRFGVKHDSLAVGRADRISPARPAVRAESAHRSTSSTLDPRKSRVVTLLEEAATFKVQRFVDQEQARLHLQSMVLRVLALDDDSWESLCSYREGYVAAEQRSDDEAMVELARYAADLIEPAAADPGEALSLDLDCLITPETEQQVEHERARFFDAYTRLKHAAGLSTQHEVARKAGLSPATVQAIEARRVRPQFRTIQRLANAFGCTPQELLAPL